MLASHNQKESRAHTITSSLTQYPWCTTSGRQATIWVVISGSALCTCIECYAAVVRTPKQGKVRQGSGSYVFDSPGPQSGAREQAEYN